VKRWLVGGALALIVTVVALFAVALIEVRRLDPAIRKRALAYLRDRFDSDIEAGELHVEVPPLALLRLLLFAGRGTLVKLDGERIVLRRRGQPALPPLFVIRHFTANLDLGTVFASPKTVHEVTLEGMEINIPPREEQPHPGARRPFKTNIQVENVLIVSAVLSIQSTQSEKPPLKFQLHNIRLTSAGKNVAMRYQASLTNAKPPGEIQSSGTFGPWAEDEPGHTPLSGTYRFEHADLGVFGQIAGILRSTGSFEGTLSSITARGEASVPDFRLTAVGNPVPLATRFEVLVDGTNGNTELKPVEATLGSTHFTTNGAIIRKEGERRRALTFTASMPSGHLRDVLRLSMKGPPIMEGTVRLNTKIVIPPIGRKTSDKLVLDGEFDVVHGRFLRANIQSKIDTLSRRGQGAPGNRDIGDVVDRMSGKYHLSSGDLKFSRLGFTVPGAAVKLGGDFNLDSRQLDFHGVLMLKARVSETVTGWKHWLLRPVDPFLAKHGSGTYLHIKVAGTAEDPHFGLDHGRPCRGCGARSALDR